MTLCCSKPPDSIETLWKQMGASGSHPVESAKGKEWDFRIEVSQKLQNELGQAVADAQNRPAMRARELAWAKEEEQKRLVREEEEMQQLARLVEEYSSSNNFRTETRPYACEAQRDAFLKCAAANPGNPAPCGEAIHAFAKCSSQIKTEVSA